MNQLTNPGALLAAQPHDPSQGGSPLGFTPREEPPEFLEYWRAIMQRKWAILGVALVAAAIAGYIVLQMKPVFRSTATVLIESSKAKVVSIEDVYSGASANREYFQTQAEVLKSRDVAQRVINRLKLATNPEFDPDANRKPSLSATLFGWIPGVDELFTPRAPTDAEGINERVMRQFAGRLSVEPVRLSQLVKVSFESNDPRLAAAVANGIAEAYVQADSDVRSSATQNAGQWINERLTELKSKLDASEKALQSYREREGLLDSKTMSLSGTGRQLDELSQKLVEARVRRSEAEEAYNQARTGEANNFESVPAVVRHPGVQRAREVEAEAEKRLADVSQRYGPDHPRYASAESDLQSARATVKRQIQAVVTSITREYTAAKATERTIESELNQAKGVVQNVNRKEIRAQELEREAAANRQIYQTFLSRYKETNVTADAQAQAPNARLVDRATPALLPVRPAKTPTVVVTFSAALVVGMLGALLLARLKNTVKTIEDVEFKLRQPFLAALPKVVGNAKSNPARAVDTEPHTPYSESIGTAATGVSLTGLDQPRKVVSITSSLPGEGKSTLAVNFALFNARIKPVVLIDADLRKPTVAIALGLDPTAKGLAELVAGMATLDECVQRVDGSSLQVITAGRIPPNPLELVASARFREVLSQIRSRFDMVIVDCPPVNLVSDALLIGTQSTGMIYVTKSDETPLPLVRSGLQRLHQAGVPIIGVVLNQHDFKKAERYYGEYSGYGKYGKYGKYGYYGKRAAARV